MLPGATSPFHRKHVSVCHARPTGICERRQRRETQRASGRRARGSENTENRERWQSRKRVCGRKLWSVRGVMRYDIILVRSVSCCGRPRRYEPGLHRSAASAYSGAGRGDMENGRDSRVSRGPVRTSPYSHRKSRRSIATQVSNLIASSRKLCTWRRRSAAVSPRPSQVRARERGQQ
jgi:hypothetical protein